MYCIVLKLNKCAKFDKKKFENLKHHTTFFKTTLYLATLQGYQKEIDVAENRCKQAEGSLKTLEVQYISVRGKTNALHEACEQLLRDQTRLSDAAQNIKDKLSYFNEYNNLRGKLSHRNKQSAFSTSQTERFSTRAITQELDISSESIIPILSKIDSCIEYCSQHGTFLDSANYLR